MMLSDVFKSFGKETYEADIETFMKAADLNQDGKISQEELLKIFSSMMQSGSFSIKGTF